MYRRFQAISDAYITDKIVDSTRRTRANVGYASTLDFFKLYGVNSSGSSTGGAPVKLTELSRALIRFDLDPIRSLTGSTIDIAHPSFKCYVNMHDVYGGQPAPSGFSLVLMPLSRSFDEGVGFDVASFNDIDSCNFLTASYSAGNASLWYLSGANKMGLLGSDDIDVISSGNLHDGNGVVSLALTQSFPVGTEDMLLDVTTLVSATLADIIPDKGFRLSFSPGEEADQSTYFVKRFASRHVSDAKLQPRLIMKFNDAVQDNQLNSYFDMSNTVFLYNYDRDGLANIRSGSAQVEVTGSNSIVMRLLTDSPSVGPSGGLYKLDVTGSQHSLAGNFVTGVYSASFTIPSSNNELSPRLALSQSITFTQIWGSADGTLGYMTTSNYEIAQAPRANYMRSHRNYMMNITNIRSAYRNDETARMRLFVSDPDDDSLVATRVPFESKSQIFNHAYYAIRDAFNEDIIIPFETGSDATRLSTDGNGMYFDLYMSDLDIGRVYEIDLLVRDFGVDQYYKSIAMKFRVDPFGVI